MLRDGFKVGIISWKLWIRFLVFKMSKGLGKIERRILDAVKCYKENTKFNS